jgi:hypothetical protein
MKPLSGITVVALEHAIANAQVNTMADLWSHPSSRRANAGCRRTRPPACCRQTTDGPRAWLVSEVDKWSKAIRAAGQFAD